ncbi:leucine zipper domain-containing protein [Kytococcus schroeteri]|uniref:leucine zipper domain-containing protein n=1 Tax=Kytococcus schroeteri TaxID=138300 RepID=UPI0035EF5D65
MTPRARLRLAKLIVQEGWPVAVAAKMFLVSPPTARKWAARYRAEGPAGMTDRTSRPHVMPALPNPGWVAGRRVGPGVGVEVST